MSRLLCVKLLVLAALALAAPVSAQTYPSKVVKIVVPFPPGGSTDALARRIADKLQASMGQPVIVENKPGAGGIVGSDMVAKSSPDGYTLLMGVTGSHGISVSLKSDLPYHPLKSFEPITRVVTAPLVLVTGPAVPAKTLPEFIAYVKGKPDQVTHSSPGVGTSMHLTGEMFNLAAKTQLVHVAYRGSAGAVNDLIGGHVQTMFGDVLVTLPFIESGQITALAVTSKERHPLLPKVPTVAESGFPGFEALSWQGLFAPAGTPKAIIDKLNAEVVRAIESPEVRDNFGRQGFIVAGSTPAEFRAYIEQEIPKWAHIIKEAKVATQ
jgi:tripartite-type tricarboxylate transporter receptor subunit TctC